MTEIDYWFSVGSTYNYLTVMRIAEVERASEVTFRWRPFSMWKILREMNNVPFADKPVKAAYMWRDIERRAARYGLKPNLPTPYPAKQVAFGIQVAFLGMREGWGKDFVRASYRALFEEGVEPYIDPALSRTLTDLGQGPARVMAAATSEENERLLDAETDVARKQGIFGSPTFVVDGELFWGDDRLDDALQWHRNRTLTK